LIRSTIKERLRPISPTLASLVPEEMVQDEFDMAGLRLSKDAPDQFQQYDRARAEAEFRLGIAPPLLVLGQIFVLRLPWRAGILLTLVVFASCATIAFQGLQHRQRSEDLLATALYFGYTSAPIFDVLSETARRELQTGRSDADLYDLAWLCDWLAERSRFERYASFVSRLRHPSQSQARTVERASVYMRESTKRELVSLGLLGEQSGP